MSIHRHKSRLHHNKFRAQPAPRQPALSQVHLLLASEIRDTASASVSAQHVKSTLPAARVIDITDHSASASASLEIRERAISEVQNIFPRMRRARGVYAFAQGLHTVMHFMHFMHYPQHFLVTLRGEPAVRSDLTTAPSMVTGYPDPTEAVNSALRFAIMDPELNQRSMCNHPSCIYNQGDLISYQTRSFQGCSRSSRCTTE